MTTHKSNLPMSYHRFLPHQAIKYRGIGSVISCLLGMGLLFALAHETAYGQKQSPTRPPRRIYVPVENLDALLTPDNPGVMLSKEEFETLARLAAEHAASTPRKPAPYLVERSQYEARIVDDQLLISAKLHLLLLDQSWVTVPIPIAGLSVESARSGDRNAQVARTEKGDQLLWFVRGEGRHSITLELARPLAVVGSDRLATFSLAPAPVGRLTLTLLEKKFLVVDGITLEPANKDDDSATVRIPIGGREQIELRITDRIRESRTDSLTLAQTAYGLQVAPGEVTWTARTRLDVFGRKIDRLVASVPSQLEITSVDSLGLEAWELADDQQQPGRTLITLNYRQPFDGNRTVTFRGVLSNIQDEHWSAPTLQLKEITSHTGVITVQHPPGIRVMTLDTKGLRSIAKDQTGENVSLQFHAFEENYTLELRTQTKTREVHAAMTNILDVTPSGLDLYVMLNVETFFGPLYELELTLPAEWQVRELTVQDKQNDWSSTPLAAGINRIRIPFSTPLKPGQNRAVQMIATRLLENWPIEETPVRFAIPEVRLPQAGVIEALYGITSREDLKLSPMGITGLDPASADDLAILQEKIAGTGKTLRLGFSYQDTVFRGQIEAVRNPTQISAITMTFFRVDQETLFAHLESQLRIQGGGVHQLAFSLPVDAGDDLRFQIVNPLALIPAQARSVSPWSSVKIVEQQASEPENGKRTWTLKLDRRFHGDLIVSTVSRRPRGEASSFVPPVLELLGTDRQNGYIAVEAAPNQRMTLTAKAADGSPLPAVDPVDIPAVFGYQPQERVVACVRYLRPGYQVSVTGQRFDRVAMPTVVCHSAEFTTIIGKAGTRQHQAEFQMTALGVQGLSVRLSAGQTLWAALIDGKPIEVRNAGDSFFLPLSSSPDTEEGQHNHVIRLLYNEQGTGLEHNSTLHQVPPTLLAISGNGTAHPIEILQQRWMLHLPEETWLTRSQGGFHPTTELSGESWLARFWQDSSLPSLRELKQMLFVLAVLFLAVMTIASLHRRFGAKGIGLLAIPVLLLGLLYGWFSLSLGRHGNLATSRERTSSSPVAHDAYFDQDGSSFGFFGRNGPPQDDQIQAPAGGEGGLFAQDAPSGAAQPGLAKSAEPEMPPRPESKSKQAANGTPDPFAPVEVDMANNLNLPPSNQLLAESLGRPSQETGGLLSLTLDLTPPEDFTSVLFSYAGSSWENRQRDLKVTLIDRSSVRMLSATVAAFTLLLMWWFRHASNRCRAVLAVFFLFVPPALVPLVPLFWRVWLDAALLGGGVGIVLWLIMGCLRLCWKCRCCQFLFRTRVCRTTFILLVYVGGLILGPRNLAADPASKPTQKKTTGPEEPYVLIPYVPGTDPLAADKIFLPQDLFLKMWKMAKPEEQPEPAPPRKSLVSAALYSAELDTRDQKNPSVRVAGRFVLHQLSDRSAPIQLPLGQVAWEQATLDGKPATLQVLDNGQLGIILPRPGTHLLDAVFRVPAPDSTLAAGEFTLPLKAVPAGKLAFTLPQAEDLQLRLNGAQGVYRIHQTNGKRVLETSADKAGNYTLSWQTRTKRSSAGALLQADTQIAAAWTDAGLHLKHTFQIQVRQGTISDLRFLVPEDFQLQRLSGPDVEGWELKQEEQARQLTIFLRRAVDDSTAIEVDLFRPLDISEKESAITLSALAPIGVTRETGTIGLFAADSLLLRPQTTKGLRQIDKSDFSMENSPQPHHSLHAAFRFVGRSFTLEVAMRRQQPETRLIAEHGVDIGLRKTRIASRFLFDLRHAPQPSLSFLLPRDFLTIDVAAEHQTDWYVSETDNARILTVELDKPRLGHLQVMIAGHKMRNPNQPDELLQLPAAMDVQRVESRVGVWIEDIYSAVAGDLSRWKAMDPQRLSTAQQQLRPQRAQFAYESRDPQPGTISFRLTKTVPELAGNLVMLLATTDVSIDYGLTLQWTIDGAAADTFAISTPEWLGTAIDFTGENIRDIRSESTPDGRRHWTIQLHEPVRKEYLLSARVTLGPAEEGHVRVPDIRFQKPSSSPEDDLQLAVQNRSLVLVNLAETGRLIPVDADRIVPADRDNLPLTLRSNLLDQAVAIAALPIGQELPEWKLQPLENSETAVAKVLLGALKTTLERDGTWWTEATYRIRSRGRQFLSLHLPKQSRLLAVFVKGRPVRAIRHTIGDATLHLVPMPPTSLADLSFEIRVMLAGQLARPLPQGIHITAQELEIPAPHVVSLKESPEYGMPVLQTTWELYYPEDLQIDIVDNQGKSNLGEVSEQSLASTDLQASLQDLVELMAVAKSESNTRQAKVSLSNLATVLEKLQQPGARTFSTTQTENDATRTLQEAAKLLAEKKPILVDSQENEIILDAQGAGRNFIRSNADQIVIDNSKSLPTKRRKAEAFAFRRGDQGITTGKSQNKKGELLEKQSKDRNEIRRQLRDQKLNLRPQKPASNKEADSRLSLQIRQQQQMDDLETNEQAEHADRAPNQPPRNFAGDDLALGLAGGLSLEMTFPENGRKLALSKISGQPKLTLAMRSRESLRAGRGTLWAFLWVGLAVWTLRLFFRTARKQMAWSHAASVWLITIGLIGSTLFPGPARSISFGLLLIGTAWIVWLKTSQQDKAA